MPRLYRPEIIWLRSKRTFPFHWTSNPDYIWRSTTGNIMEQTELFRLTRALETASSQQWVYHVLSDPEWLRLHQQRIGSSATWVEEKQ